MVIFRTFPYNSLILWVDVNKQWPLRYFMHPLRGIAKHLGEFGHLPWATVECTKAKGAAETHLIQFQLCYLPVA